MAKNFSLNEMQRLFVKERIPNLSNTLNGKEKKEKKRKHAFK